MNDKKWVVYVYDDEIHVVPEWERQSHDKAHTCTCLPQKEVAGGILLVKHNAFDGEHLIEDGMKLINTEELGC